jgi:ankyrin repeat protein
MGLDVNQSAGDCTTPLHQAALQGRADVVRRMLELGADANAPDYFGKKPADVARAPEVRRVLEEFAARASR